MAHTYALIRDPVEGVTPSPITSMMRRRLGVLFRDLTIGLEQFDERFPRQLIHGDFYPSNVLMVDGRVSGILDFEYSGPGVRAMDLAVGLGAFAPPEWRFGDAMPHVERFVAGYRQWVLLTPDEIAALPALLRLREATSWLHWLGRHSQGLTSDEDIVERAERLVALDDNLTAHGEELVRCINSAFT
jgi:homoserine kinase type II